MKCEMCGSEENLYRAKIEGAEMAVCKSCGEYGEIISKIKKPAPEKKKKSVNKKKKQSKKPPEEPKTIMIIRDDYSKVIKEKRERRGLKQEELAQRIGEKVSVIHHLETGHREPSIELARKLEKFLKVKLVKEHKEKNTLQKKSSEREVTIGDMISLS